MKPLGTSTVLYLSLSLQINCTCPLSTNIGKVFVRHYFHSSRLALIISRVFGCCHLYSKQPCSIKFKHGPILNESLRLYGKTGFICCILYDFPTLTGLRIHFFPENNASKNSERTTSLAAINFLFDVLASLVFQSDL